ncbi:hypothetical protein DACRYDRAFT_116979 [Dacryopinax primogenitus]|uniref:Uncharacterized protein n=1 Tax=Dacryopinax primogenitus (strain DJM 731) TaxID=1858805 RepID=M5FZA9_DACPD|nr:uncharacterized protein DACRYDRAFT_116979 [Dacryopinax primogenitus]EJU01190.1 hypothetical protein DACRYDRAFT_116979 [Dacryopinax primogenitus]
MAPQAEGGITNTTAHLVQPTSALAQLNTTFPPTTSSNHSSFSTTSSLSSNETHPSTTVATVTSVTTTLFFGTTASSVVIEVPAGSIFTSLPTSTPLPVEASSSHLSTWKTFLVAFFTIVFFFLFLRLGLYFLVRRGATTMERWPHWLQVLCCYRLPEDDEDDFVDEPRLMRQSYFDGGAYSEASRAQALALVRESSASHWRNRVRTRPMSPSQDDPVPPYPGPPLTPLDNPFGDSSAVSVSGSGAEDSQVESKESESPVRPSGSTRPPPS